MSLGKGENKNMGMIEKTLRELKENECKKLTTKNGASYTIERYQNANNKRRYMIEIENNNRKVIATKYIEA